jgi:hypothetical protein
MEKGGKGFSLPPQTARKSSLKSNPPKQGILFCFVGVICIALYEKKKNK